MIWVWFVLAEAGNGVYFPTEARINAFRFPVCHSELKTNKVTWRIAGWRNELFISLFFFYNFSIYLFVFPSCCCCWFIFVSFLGFLTWGTEGNRERENVVAVVAVVAVGERSRKQMKFSNKEWRRSERSDPHPLHVKFNRIKLIDKDNRRRTLNERMVIGCDDDANVPPLLSVSSDSFGAGWGEGREKEREEEEGEEEGGVRL